jgi:hypothetical protein
LKTTKIELDNEGKKIAPQALAFSLEGIKELNQKY